MAELPTVRTITVFASLDASPASSPAAQAIVEQGGRVLLRVFKALEGLGFTVQTLRLATNAFEEWAAPQGSTLSADHLSEAARAIIHHTNKGILGDSGCKVSLPLLVTLGPATTPAACALIPELIRRVPEVTASADLGRMAGWAPEDRARRAVSGVAPGANPDMCQAAADVMAELATTTPHAAGNFNFAALARCPPCIPFFPAAFAPSPCSITGSKSRAPCDAAAAALGRALPEDGGTAALPPRLHVAVGLQHANITVAAVERAAADHAVTGAAAGSDAGATAADDDGLSADEVGVAAAAALLPHCRTIEAAVVAALTAPGSAAAGAKGAPAAAAAAYAGLDTSFAPSPATPALTRLFAAAGVPHLGAPGALTVASALTAACKTLGVPDSERPLLVGYCGLMLPPLEDVGLAEGATKGEYGVTTLLALSSVCGIGLDTVPVHVDGLFIDGKPSTVPGKRWRSIERVLGDVAALAHRLGKPLSCRLFPYPAEAGAMTSFDHPHMCNTTVFPLR